MNVFTAALFAGLICSVNAINNVPPELAIIGQPSQTLSVKFSPPCYPSPVNVQTGGLLVANRTFSPEELYLSSLDY
jgi:hypothetical protein